MSRHPTFHGYRRGPWRQSHGRPPGLDGFSGDAVQPHRHEHIAAIKARGGIELESYDGGPRGFGQLALITSDMQEALAKRDVIMVVVPSSAHADIARLVAPHLRDGQIVVLKPRPHLWGHRVRQGAMPTSTAWPMSPSPRPRHSFTPAAQKDRLRPASSGSRRRCR